MHFIPPYVIIIDNDNIRSDFMQLNYGIDELDKIDLTTFLPIILPIAIIGFILVLTALIDLYRHRKTRRNLMLWTVIILFANTLGPILYFVIGRKDREQR